MEFVGDVLNGGTPAGESLLYGEAHALEEILVIILASEFFLKLRGQHSQQFRIPGYERQMRIGCAEDDCIAGGLAIHRATKVALDRFGVPPGPGELIAQRRHVRARTVTADREHPGKAAID